MGQFCKLDKGTRGQEFNWTALLGETRRGVGAACRRRPEPEVGSSHPREPTASDWADLVVLTTSHVFCVTLALQ